MHHVLEFNQSQLLKPYIEFNTQKTIKIEKNNDKDGKAFYKLMNNGLYQKAMENLRNWINVRLRNNEKDYLKCTSKPRFMSHKTFDNNLIVITKRKVTLKLSKLAYIVCILGLHKVLMCELHYNYIKSKYDNKSKLLFADFDS